MGWTHKFADAWLEGDTGSGTRGSPWSVKRAFDSAVAGDWVWIRSYLGDTYTPDAGLDIANSGSVANNTHIVFCGCRWWPVEGWEDTNIRRHDMDLGGDHYGGAMDAYRENHSLPLAHPRGKWVVIDGDGLADDLLTIDGKDNIEFRNIYFKGTDKASGHDVIHFANFAKNVRFVNCKVNEGHSLINGAPKTLTLDDCWLGDDFEGNYSMPIVTTYFTYMVGCVIDTRLTRYGIYIGGYGAIENCIFVNGVRAIRQFSDRLLLRNNLFYNQTGECVRMDNSACILTEYNNIFVVQSVNDYAIYLDAANGSIACSDYSLAYCTASPFTVDPWLDHNTDTSFMGPHAVKDVDPRLIDPAGGDFGLHDGSPCWGAGRPLLNGELTHIGPVARTVRGPVTRRGIYANPRHVLGATL